MAPETELHTGTRSGSLQKKGCLQGALAYVYSSSATLQQNGRYRRAQNPLSFSLSLSLPSVYASDMAHRAGVVEVDVGRSEQRVVKERLPPVVLRGFRIPPPRSEIRTPRKRVYSCVPRV